MDQPSEVEGIYRTKISGEKEKRRKSHTIQKVLLHQKEEITASATGKPAANSTRISMCLPFKAQQTVPEASSSGRVLSTASRRVTTGIRGESVSQSCFGADDSHLDDATGNEWEQAKQFEWEDDPEAGLDEPLTTTHEYEGARSSTSSEPMFPYQEDENLHINYTLDSSTAEEYWNLEPEDSGLSYLDLLHCPPLPSTIDGGFSEADNTSTHDVNFTFDTTTSARNPSLSDAEDMDTSWSLHSSGLSEAPPYNFDFIPASDQGYPYRDMDYFGFNPTVATAHSPQPELFLPLPPLSLIPPDSPKLMPQDSLPGPNNPNKQLQISDLTEENILPDHEHRKRSKLDRLTL